MSDSQHRPTEPQTDSPFQDKLRTNHLPTQDEVHGIRAFVSKKNFELEQLDSEIASVELSLVNLVEKRKKIQEVLNAHKALISPMRRLPPEILQQIFVACLPQTRNAVMHATEAPVLLGRICTRWRKISQATSELWSTIHIVPPNVNIFKLEATAQRFRQKMDVINMWLSKAGTCPLCISFFWFWGDTTEEMDLCNMLLGTLVPFCRQWRELDLRVPLKMCKSFSGLDQDSVPMLETLKIEDRYTGTSEDQQGIEGLMFASQAPRFRSLAFLFHSGGIGLPAVPLGQLTELNLETMVHSFVFTDPQEMLSKLSLCSNLRSCTLRFPLSMIISAPDTHYLDYVVTLPKLRVLCVDGDQTLSTPFHMMNTLANLSVPALRELEFVGRYGIGGANVETNSQPFAPLKKLLSQSMCMLQRLELQSLSLLEGDLLECLRLVPTLVELIINNSNVPPPVVLHNQIDNSDDPEVTVPVTLFELLIIRPNDSSDYICPNLEQFDFDKVGIEQSTFCNLVRSRWRDVPKGVARLKNVRCIFFDAEDGGVTRQVQEMREEGLVAEVVYPRIWPDQPDPSPWAGVESY